MEKGAGVLLHVTSLPNKYGIGTLGVEAYRFVDFLERAKQKYWQVLPITPTNYGDSPYQSASVFAFNQFMIDFEFLTDMNLLKPDDYEHIDFGKSELDVDYEKLFYNKNAVLKEIFHKHMLYSREFKSFVQANSDWLEGYAIYSVIKEHFGHTAWETWPDEYRLRDPQTIKSFTRSHKKEIETVKFIQFVFQYQWLKLKKYANDRGVQIIGDMPIYAAYDSADVWMNPEMFYLDDKLAMVKVAGCPPDAFTADGQLWGNPLYRWDVMKNEEYAWWVKRIERAFEMFDVVRIDHFRGFAGYYTIPANDTNARNGEWREGPGYDLFRVINEKIPNADIIAENLGFLDDAVKDLLEKCRYPGMNIGQFDFGDGMDYSPLVHNELTENNVIYTGTHDNQTITSWYNELEPSVRARADQYFGITAGSEPHLKIIEKVYQARPFIAIIPLQDFLGVEDQDGRMNIPSTLGCNWRYRCKKQDYDADLADYIRRITEKYNRD